MSVEIDVIGEVIEASTTEFVAESRELHAPPPFGSFVKVRMTAQAPAPLPAPQPDDDPFSENSFRQMAGSFGRTWRGDEPAAGNEPGVALAPSIYAVVYQAVTAPVDPSRRLRAFWKDEETRKREQPEVEEWLLVTHFNAIIIGYSEGGRVAQFLPPIPPRILSQVAACDDDEVRAITERFDFLRTLAGFRNAPAEEVIAACIRTANAVRGNSFEFLVDAGKELAALMKDDYDRLSAIMRRVTP